MRFDCYSHVSIFDNWTKTNDKNMYFKIEKKIVVQLNTFIYIRNIDTRHWKKSLFLE